MPEENDKKSEKEEKAPTVEVEAEAEDAEKEPEQEKVDEVGNEEQIAKLKEDVLRAKAETQNTIKRMMGDIERARSRGAESILLGLLDIADSLERALEQKHSDNKDAVIDGVALVLSQLEQLMRNNGLEIVEPKPGERLDPHLHEAISKEEAKEVEENAIVRTVRKGYRHERRVLRPASVIVSVAAPKDGATDGEDEAKSKSEQGSEKQ